MNLEQQLIHTTMRVQTQDKDGRPSVATAFVYHEPADGENEFYAFLISNKHVLLSDASSLKVSGLCKDDQGNPIYGCTTEIDLRCPSCGEFHIFGHPDPDVDVAAIGIGRQLNEQNIFYRAIGPSNLLNAQGDDKGLMKGLFESIMFIGYPAGLYDTHNVLPIARFGRLATMLDFDYLGKPQFLIDASVFPGSSGSPVFVFRKFQRKHEKGFTFGEEPYFLGVLAAVHQKKDYGNIIPVNFAVEMSREINLGLVFKQETVVTVIQEALQHGHQRT